MKKFKISHVFIYLLLILLTLICVVPFYIMVINATHSTNELYTGLSVVPGKYLLDNLRNMLSMVNMPRGFLNRRHRIRFHRPFCQSILVR